MINYDIALYIVQFFKKKEIVVMSENYGPMSLWEYLHSTVLDPYVRSFDIEVSVKTLYSTLQDFLNMRETCTDFYHSIPLTFILENSDCDFRRSSGNSILLKNVKLIKGLSYVYPQYHTHDLYMNEIKTDFLRNRLIYQNVFHEFFPYSPDDSNTYDYLWHQNEIVKDYIKDSAKEIEDRSQSMEEKMERILERLFYCDPEIRAIHANKPISSKKSKVSFLSATKLDFSEKYLEYALCSGYSYNQYPYYHPKGDGAEKLNKIISNRNGKSKKKKNKNNFNLSKSKYTNKNIKKH